MAFSTADRPIVVIGAGIGGLSTAIRLAGQGQHVHIYEQQSYVGGKMNEVRADGFRWDTGPSIITMRSAFEELFTAVGKCFDDYLTFVPVAPLMRYFYPDGVQIDLTHDLAQMTAQIAKLDERDVAGFLGFLSYSARLQRITNRVFLSDAADGGIALELLPAFWQLDPLRSMEDGLRRHLHSRHLRQLFGRFATYVGASPFHARGTLNAIAHRELSGDWWYPKGGVYTIARALERLAKELGVQIHTSSPVRQIVVEAATASGVMLADGSQIDVSAVISNVDVAMAYDKLLPAAAIPERPRQRMLTRMPSASSFIMLLGVEGQHPHLAHHNVFFSHDDKREFHDIFGRGLPTDDPSIYVAITAKHDAQDAPAGCENWFVMVNTPPLSNKFDWAVNAPAYRALVLERLASFGVDIRDHIRSERLITPLDHERLAGARRGALYGLPADNVIATLQRPQNRDPHVQRLYHVGGSTHLAGGVPMIVQSGAVVARLLAQDLL